MQQEQGHRAGRVIWDWRGVRSARLLEERKRHTRRVGVIQGIVGGLIAAAFYYYERRIFGTVVLSIAAFSLFAALLSPMGLSLRLQHFLFRVGMVVGHLLTWILLVPLFFLFFVPFRLLLRRGRRDPLDRRLEPERASYWRARDLEEPGAESYQRQF